MLGLLSYYGRYVPNFVREAKTLYDLVTQAATINPSHDHEKCNKNTSSPNHHSKSRGLRYIRLC
jgi:hypothetical protein